MRNSLEQAGKTLESIVEKMQKCYDTKELTKQQVSSYYENKYPEKLLRKMLKHLNLD